MVDRIVRAHKENEKFKIIVLLPLLPCFPGEIDSVKAYPMRFVT